MQSDGTKDAGDARALPRREVGGTDRYHFCERFSEHEERGGRSRPARARCQGRVEPPLHLPVVDWEKKKSVWHLEQMQILTKLILGASRRLEGNC